MARKKVGYVELLWTCPNCNGVNPGSVRLCGNCGAPQPQNVKFYQGSRQELVKDKAKIASAEAGADIHCPYCGTRNPAGTKICRQCGGNLEEGIKRESGRVIGAFRMGPVRQVRCANCGAENPDTSTACSQCGASLIQAEESQKSAPVPKPARLDRRILWALGIVGVLLCAGVMFLLYLSGRTQQLTGTVQSVEWRRAIPIEALVPVEYSAWHDEIPAGAAVEACQEELRYTQDEPTSDSIEVCGTPYTVDTGGGFAEVVQDCEYQIYDSFCTYIVDEWKQVDLAVLTGTDFTPRWPEPRLESGQRLGENIQETYTIVLSSGEETYVFTTRDVDLFQQAQVGTTWNLSVNTFGDVVSLER
jgi:ribosomal protein L40E